MAAATIYDPAFRAHYFGNPDLRAGPDRVTLRLAMNNDLDHMHPFALSAGPPPTATEVPAAALRIVFPPDLTPLAPIPVGGLPVVIGRSAGHGATDVVPHPTVSRTHLTIRYEPIAQVHVAADLGSHNGTRLDGAKVGRDELVLRDGAVLRLGGVVLVYEVWPDGPESDAGAACAMIGEAPAAQRLRGDVARAAGDRSPVLVVGQAGTGKEWIARELHRLSGRSGELVVVDCAKLAGTLVDSQRLGSPRGTFKGAAEAAFALFQRANRGALYFDEIGDLPADLQPKLLRWMEEAVVGPIGAATDLDVRVIAATTRDLDSMVAQGQFRRDLRLQLSTWELRAPPLVQRRGDLLYWVDVFAQQYAEKRQLPAFGMTLDVDTVEHLLLHDWPDNLRGVQRFVYRFADAGIAGRELSLRDVTSLIPVAAADPPAAVPTPRDTDPERTDRVRGSTRRANVHTGLPAAPTKAELARALSELGSVRATAKHFDRDRKQIYRWIRRHGIVWNG